MMMAILGSHAFSHIRSKLLLLPLQGCVDGEEVDDGAYGGEYDYVDEGTPHIFLIIFQQYIFS